MRRKFSGSFSLTQSNGRTVCDGGESGAGGFKDGLLELVVLYPFELRQNALIEPTQGRPHDISAAVEHDGHRRS